jgi:hypothetical protein
MGRLLTPGPRHDAAWVASALNRADATLAAPPSRPHLKRVAPVGRCVQRFVLPLELCQPQNRTRHGAPWMLGKVKRELGLLMFVQARGKRRAPLPGRPFVRCVRFSTVEPDRYADWAKAAVDRLTSKKDGLGFLRDDRPADVEVDQAWEYAAPSRGFCLVEVWTGDPEAKVEPQKPKRRPSGNLAPRDRGLRASESA